MALHGAQQLILSGAAVLGGGSLFFRGFHDFRTRQLIANTPTARVRSMAMGLVEINGAVEPRSQMTGPFSGRACAFWEIEIAVRGRKNTWNTVHKQASGQPFFLRDETGLAMVYPAGATCRLNFGVEEVCSGILLPEPYSSWLAEQNLPMKHLWRLTAMRFRERLIEEGQRVYVLGTAVPKPQVLVVSDGEEMAATGTDDMPWSARIKQRSAEVCAIVRRGEHEKVFIISQTPERELSFMLGIQAWAELVGGPVLAIGGLAFLLDALR